MLGQAFFNAVEATGKLKKQSSNPPRRPAPSPSPSPSSSTGTPSASGASSARVGEAYEVTLDAKGRSGGSWYVNFDDGTAGQWIKGTTVRATHAFTSTSGERIVRSFYEVDGKRSRANNFRVEVRSGSSARTTSPEPRTPANPAPVSGKPAASGGSSARVGEAYVVTLDAKGRSGGSWYVNFDDGTAGQWIKGTTVRATHAFTSTSGERIVRSFYEVDGKRSRANDFRVEVRSGSSARTTSPEPRTPANPAPVSGKPAASGGSSARVGEAYVVTLDAKGRSGGSWYVNFDDGTAGQWIKGTTVRATHAFTSTSGERIVRSFYEVDGKRSRANDFRVEVVAAGSSRQPAAGASPAPQSPNRGDGKVTRDYWTNLRGGDVSDLTGSSRYPGRPTGTTTLERLRSGHWNNPRDNVDFADRYGERIRGFLVAPETGAYRFWISGDDQATFSLSSDTRTSKLREVARVDGWTKPQQWDKDKRQRSGTVYLVAGRSYALEILHKEASGGDHVAVGWRTPSQGGGSRPSEIIGSEHLSSFAV